jgi:hypothetical protein
MHELKTSFLPPNYEKQIGATWHNPCRSVCSLEVYLFLKTPSQKSLAKYCLLSTSHSLSVDKISLSSQDSMYMHELKTSFLPPNYEKQIGATWHNPCRSVCSLEVYLFLKTPSQKSLAKYCLLSTSHSLSVVLYRATANTDLEKIGDKKQVSSVPKIHYIYPTPSLLNHACMVNL